ncbi:N-acetylglutaminylglutamine amidotransferase [Solirubrobacter ginsenosidimutans]|uniref:asparagine synthase (glutamine-hydrolyzing) n=1 Tax=Solirubrobacter ginsenosidimutans TaxID=490573 RepID=A0A9X3MU47_9ACTN|nr:N-acetylglutaminylglutamine amidotransferase [Solirubrobacter ginsenosidimutans]MDA0162462.1 N-acetylglutaminylglutamine amidotransferase [Solirubrobacter ginsenosidimutans]
MCGFGIEVRRDGRADRDALERMGASMAARGPDGSGVWVDRGVGMVHRRLAIIELSELGAQPMRDGELTIVFNGCIYNHHELRAELRALGHSFASLSDTEVLLKGWREWGSELPRRLHGMFAFALHDGARTFLVRDRLGVKPLYLADVPGALRAASTLPALLAGGGVDTRVDPVALHHYLSWHSVVPAPRTILRGVTKVPPATVLVIEADGRRSSTVYWDPPFERRLDVDDWPGAMREALQLAVRRRMVADVPVGILLSGGLDSSLIVALLARAGQTGLATFSIGFEDVGELSGDEFAFSDLVAREFGTDHHQLRIDRRRLVEALPQAIEAMSEPMVSHDCVAFWLLSEAVRRERKVVQSGQGADEVLGGYDWYPPLLDAPGDGLSTYAASFFDRDDAGVRALLADAPDEDVSLAFARSWFSRGGATTPVDRALRLDTEVMLVDDPVKRVDNMTMAHGLEARTPFLDHELVELAAACPPELKLADGGKGVLKDAARGVVPDAVIDRPKGYFPVPALTHLEGPVLAMVTDALRSSDRGLFRREAVDAMLADPNADRTNLDGSSLWQLGLLELWLQRHVDQLP